MGPVTDPLFQHSDRIVPSAIIDAAVVSKLFNRLTPLELANRPQQPRLLHTQSCARCVFFQFLSSDSSVCGPGSSVREVDEKNRLYPFLYVRRRAYSE